MYVKLVKRVSFINNPWLSQVNNLMIDTNTQQAQLRFTFLHKHFSSKTNLLFVSSSLSAYGNTLRKYSPSSHASVLKTSSPDPDLTNLVLHSALFLPQFLCPKCFLGSLCCSGLLSFCLLLSLLYISTFFIMCLFFLSSSGMLCNSKLDKSPIY